MLRTLAVLSFLLAANGSAARAEPPPATYRIAGIVVDSVTGQPIERAEVTVAPVTALDDAQTFETSSDGHFLFANLPRGKYRLLASRRGYATQALHQHESYWTSIAVGPGLDSEHIRFPLTPSSVITGTVTDDWGDPVRDAKVLLFQQSMFDGFRSLRNINQATTDDQGRYRFAHLLSGTYSVAVYARPWYTQSPEEYPSRPSLRAKLTSAENAAVYDGPQPLQATTDESLFDVVYPIAFFPNATNLAEATRFALAPGATETADIQLRAVPSVHLRLRVPVQDGQQTTNPGESSTDVAQVDVSPDVALKIGDSYTDQIDPTRTQIAPGIVELSGIPPGQIEVNMMTASILGLQDDSIVSRARTLTVSGDTELDLSPQGDSAAVSGVVLSSKFSLPPAPSAQPPQGQTSPDEATLVQAMPEASSNVMLILRSLKSGDSYSATVSLHGNFSFAASSLPVGSYEVEFPAESGLSVSSIEATGATVSGRTIEIAAGQPINLTVHAAEATCRLSGFALKNGKPVAGAMVLLVPQDPGHDMSLYHRDQSDSDGSFTMSPLFPGRYILLAIQNGWDFEWADPKVMFQYLPGGQPLELKPATSLTLNAKVQ